MKNNRPFKSTLRALLTISLTFVSLYTESNAQNLGLGIKAGLSFTTQLNNFKFESDDLNLDLEPNFSTAYHLGFLYRARIGKNFRIQAEPSFLKLGASYKEPFNFRGFEFETDSETKLSYITLPIVLELTTTPPDLEEFPKPWEKSTYHLSAGIYGGYLLDATFSGINSGTPIGVDFEEEFTNDVTSQFNEFDAGLIIGAGFEYGYQNKIGMETRLMLGLLNSQNSDSNEIRPNNLSISVAIYYVL